METFSTGIDTGAIESTTDLASWNRPRSSEELQEFINSHHAQLPEGIEIE